MAIYISVVLDDLGLAFLKSLDATITFRAEGFSESSVVQGFCSLFFVHCPKIDIICNSPNKRLFCFDYICVGLKPNNLYNCI